MPPLGMATGLGLGVPRMATSSGSSGVAPAPEAPWSADGKFGNCIELDGVGQYVNCGNVPITNANGFSVSAWVSITLSGNALQVVTKGYGNDGSFQIAEVWSSYDPGSVYRKFKFQVYIAGVGWKVATMGTVLSLATWYNIICTYDATATTNNLIIYLNGVQDGIQSSTAANAMAANAYNFELGHNNQYPASSYLFNGGLDEVRLYDTALTSANAVSIYNGGSGDDPDNPTASGNLIAQWKLNESSGSTAEDSAGSYDGTVINP